MRTHPLFIAICCVLVASPGLAKPPVVATGWDSPTPAQFREHVAEFEKWGLFDGTTIKPTRRSGKGVVATHHTAFSREPWHWEQFAEALVDLRAAQTTTCRETFLMVYANPGDVDWFDDAGWKEVVDHWRLLARLAKQGGLRGLLYDAEPYVKPFSQFRYSAQAGRAEHTFAEYRAKARERGRAVMEAVGEEFPDATIFTYRLFSDMLSLLDSGDINRALEGHSYGLQPAFVDGWMDALPDGLTIIEGTEDIGYRANSPAEYNAAFTVERLRLPEFLAAENRQKFSRCLRIGQSLYLDAHINPPGNAWHIDSSGSTPAARLAANLSSALAASDGLVWLYGEQARWWPGGKAESKTWAEIFPNIEGAIRQARDPLGYARELFAAGSSRENLLTNGDFAKTSDGRPTGWFTWQDDGSHGSIAGVDGRVVLSGVAKGVAGSKVEVKAGDVLAARLRVKVVGSGRGGLTIGWKTSAGDWTAHAKNIVLFPDGPEGADGWREIYGLVEVPPSAGQLIFMASTSAQTSDEDRCEFDDAALIALP